MLKSKLLSCKNVEISSAKYEDLTDVSAVVKTENPVSERLLEFVNTVKNPYCFRVKNIRVKLVFSDKAAAPSVENLLVNIATRILK